MTQSFFHITAISSNRKTGPIPVTTSAKNTCPSTCPLKEKGCYAKQAPMIFHWNKVSNGERGTNYAEFLDVISRFKKGTFWRHNQAGDLVGTDNKIDSIALNQLVEANKNKKGFSYTHYPMDNENNKSAIKNANDNGFTINLSANSLSDADNLKALNVGPVVVILPLDAKKVSYTPKGNKIVVCPAQTVDKVSCNDCRLCAKSDRNYIIGFKAHGTAKVFVDKLSQG